MRGTSFRARGRLPYHHGDLRRALTDVALRLVTERGPGGFTLREAARVIGVSQTAPYRHFRTKEALLAAVAEEGFEELRDRMRRALRAAAHDPLERLYALGLSYVLFAVDYPSRFRVMFGPEIRDKSEYPSLATVAREAFSLVPETIAACQHVGLVRAREPADLAIAAWSIAHGVASLLIDNRLSGVKTRNAVRRTARSLIETLYLGLRSDGTPSRRSSTPPARGNVASRR